MGIWTLRPQVAVERSRCDLCAPESAAHVSIRQQSSLSRLLDTMTLTSRVSTQSLPPVILFMPRTMDECRYASRLCPFGHFPPSLHSLWALLRGQVMLMSQLPNLLSRQALPVWCVCASCVPA